MISFDLSLVADTMRFAFKRGYIPAPAYKDGDAALVERVTVMRDIGLNCSQVKKHIDMRYHKFHRLSINLPEEPHGSGMGLLSYKTPNHPTSQSEIYKG